MNNIEPARTNMAAVEALKKRYSNIDDETLVDIVETARPHIEAPLRDLYLSKIKS